MVALAAHENRYPDGFSLYHYLCTHGETYIIWKLDYLCHNLQCSNGLFDSQDEDGCTPLMYAVSHGNAHAITWLLEKGADTSLTTNAGWSVLDTNPGWKST
jgi:hypothetical protein